MRPRVPLRATFAALLSAIVLAVPHGPAQAQVSVNIGINVPVYPQLVAIPGYPVYYAPSLDANYFFYDGVYWYFDGDRWYASSWYNGPWRWVVPDAVPVYLLRVPVRYYRHPPPYFRSWRADAPPRWGQHWGNDWERRHAGWDRWDRHDVPVRAAPPAYQRHYSGDRYPGPDRQHDIESRNYRHQPRDQAVRQFHEANRGAPPPSGDRGHGGERHAGPPGGNGNGHRNEAPRGNGHNEGPHGNDSNRGGEGHGRGHGG